MSKKNDVKKAVELAVVQATADPTPQATATQDILEQLDLLGNTRVSEKNIRFEGSQIILPEALKGDVGGAIDFLKELKKAEEEKYEFIRTYDFKPWDGAAAFDRAMLRVFGTRGVGKTVKTMFGDYPPERITVKTGLDTQIEVPWGEIEFKPLGARFHLDYNYTDRGPVFQMDVTVPRKYLSYVEGFLAVIQDELEKRSIYRGKAIDGGEHPNFVDVAAVDPSRVVYARDVQRELDSIWTIIDSADELRSKGIPLKHAVLLEGPYGSGKSLAGSLTGQKALAQGWTYILVRAGDDPFRAMQTAAMYAPAVVWVEDLDVYTKGKDRKELAQLLEALDGVNNKGKEVVAGFTTNFASAIEKGIIRSGRIDTVIHVGAMDPDGYEQLIKLNVAKKDLQEVNYDKVAEAFHDFLPSTAVQAIHRAMRYAIARGESTISTSDLVSAAESVRPQFEMFTNAGEAEHDKRTIDEVISEQVVDVISHTMIPGVGMMIVKKK